MHEQLPVYPIEYNNWRNSKSNWFAVFFLFVLFKKEEKTSDRKIHLKNGIILLNN